MEYSNFPLHRLPKSAIFNVLKIMGILEVVTFSLCSNATKSLVESLNMTSYSIRLVFDDFISLQIRFPNNTALYISFYWQEPRRKNRLMPLRTPKVVYAEYGVEDNDELLREGKKIGKWSFGKKEGLGFGDWIRHMIWIFDSGLMHEIYFAPKSKKFYRKDIKTHLDDLLKDFCISVEDDCPNQYHQKVHRAFQPIASLQLTRNPYKLCKLRRLLCENFDSLTFGFDNLYTLDDLLSTNSGMIFIYEPNNLSMGEIRRFLKLWIAGRTSPRTYYINIEYPLEVVLDVDTILRGIHYFEVDIGKERRFTKCINDVVIKGGYDIRGRNGIVATIAVGWCAERQVSTMRMYVW